MAQKPKVDRSEPGIPGQGGKNMVVRRAPAVVAAIVVLYFVVAALFGSASSISISGPTTINLTSSITFFSVGETQYAAFFVSSPQNATYARIEVSRMPIFLGKTMYVDLYLANATSINTAGPYADVQMTLLHRTTSSATVVIVPVPIAYQQKPSSGRITLVATTLSQPGSSQSGSGAQTTTVTTTTTQTSASTTTGTSASTTIQNGGGTNLAKAQTLLAQDLYYPIMINYTNLYANETGCTSALYNSTYATKYGHTPKYYTYTNVSTLVPYQMISTIKNTSDSVYIASYSTVSHTGSPWAGTAPALTITMNVSSDIITGTVVSGSGIFSGLNYSQIVGGYSAAKNIGNACGIYVAACGVQC